MRVRFLKFWHNRKGGAAIEYSLLAALFAVGAIVAFQLFGNSLSKTYSEIPSQMDGSDGGRMMITLMMIRGEMMGIRMIAETTMAKKMMTKSLLAFEIKKN